MRAVDANVLARLILQDDEAQARLAETIVRQPFWIALTVWVELGWILYERLKLEREVVGDALQAILEIETAHGPDPQGISWAISRFRDGADWADMIHVVAAGNVADRFTTFDASIARRSGSASPLRVETLR